MDETEKRGDGDVFDDLDAFFNAAASSDAGAMSQAAAHVSQPDAAPGGAKGSTGAFAKPPDAAPAGSGQTGLFSAIYDGAPHLDGKFIAVEPGSVQGGGRSGAPFVLIPAHIHSFLPWWGWAAIFSSLLILVAGVMLMPVLSLNRLTAKLGDSNQSNVQAAMQQLVLSGNSRTVGKLYDLASSPQAGMNTRLRAVDTLGLIPAPDADRALLRLELSGTTEDAVREAASAARKQRTLSRERVRYR